MAALHSALKALSPITFSDLPQDESALDSWLSDLFIHGQTILDSIPIAEPSGIATGAKGSSSSIATNASEIAASSLRSDPPTPEHQALQKEWGKPYKLSQKENSLSMSVYKLSGKDGRGAWFARRSVHEGLPFSKFKKAMEMEFPESLAVQGAPGEGNVRGIGGETKVEDLKVPGKGQVEVYRLSAQFPGPTTPRDFVTLLVTSENAMKPVKQGESVPRHYMVVSKPCDHPETQPQSGFIRGFYESVEFIREVPRQANAGHDISNSAHQNSDEEGHLPIEWIMVTRSDPGGSVPRFMVERGTPASICTDATKFLDWACQQNFEEEASDAKEPTRPVRPSKRESFQSFRSSRMVGVDEYVTSRRQSAIPNPQAEKEVVDSTPNTDQQQQGGLMGAVSGAAQYLSSYAPQVVLDRLPGNGESSPEQSNEKLIQPVQEDDAVSEASFESADSHLTSSSSEPVSPTSSRMMAPRQSDEHLTGHEKELRKLEQRRAVLEDKFSASREKLQRAATINSEKDEHAQQKAMEKHDKELKKQQEKHDKEIKKIEQKQEKEKRKIAQKKRKQADKDEKSRLTRERDEARQELELLKRESAVLRSVVEDLQRENTTLVAQLGGDETLARSQHGSLRSVKEKGHQPTDGTFISNPSQ